MTQALASLGPFVENNAGHARFLAIYATSAIAGSLASYMFCPSMSVGASGMDLCRTLLVKPARASLGKTMAEQSAIQAGTGLFL